MGKFPLSPEKMPMLLTDEGCWGTAARHKVGLSEVTIEPWGKGKNNKEKNTLIINVLLKRRDIEHTETPREGKI